MLTHYKAQVLNLRLYITRSCLKEFKFFK